MKYLFIIVCLFFGYSSPMFSQNIKVSKAVYNCFGEEDKSHPFLSYCYSIQNNDTSRIAIFFNDIDNTTLPHEKLLVKKLFRHYGDFNWAMLISDNVLYEDTIFVPEWFVKVLSPGESFTIYLYLNKAHDKMVDNFQNHLLICKEEEFADCPFPVFLNYIRTIKIDYPFPYIILSAETFNNFINRYKNDK